MIKRICFISILFSVFLLSACSSGPEVDYGEFAKCLTIKDVKMYGTYWCGVCAEQKKLFGDSFKYVNYVECAVRGSSAQLATCRENRIESYPTWEFSGGNRSVGLLSLAEISSRSGCELPLEITS